MKADHNGNIWFTKTGDPNAIGMVDYKTMKVSLWQPLAKFVPTPHWKWTRAASCGRVNSAPAKCCASIPKRRTLKEFDLPRPACPPYGLGVGARRATFGTRPTTRTCSAAPIRRPARPSSTPSRIRKTPFANLSPILRDACGTARLRTTRLVTFIWPDRAPPLAGKGTEWPSLVTVILDPLIRDQLFVMVTAWIFVGARFSGTRQGVKV